MPTKKDWLTILIVACIYKSFVWAYKNTYKQASIIRKNIKDDGLRSLEEQRNHGKCIRFFKNGFVWSLLKRYYLHEMFGAVGVIRRWIGFTSGDLVVAADAWRAKVGEPEEINSWTGVNGRLIVALDSLSRESTDQNETLPSEVFIIKLFLPKFID
jgi:hypothetical protein